MNARLPPHAGRGERNPKNARRAEREEKHMNTNTMELNLNEMEMVNGGGRKHHKASGSRVQRPGPRLFLFGTAMPAAQ